MIDDMVVKLGVEQEDDDAQKKWCEAEFDKSEDETSQAITTISDDDAQKKWCEAEFDKSEDESKDTKRLIEGLTAKEEETSQAITTLSDEPAALKKSIKDLDQAVTDATEQRKGEHKEYVETAALNTAAVQLLEAAKNRMNK